MDDCDASGASLIKCSLPLKNVLSLLVMEIQKASNAALMFTGMPHMRKKTLFLLLAYLLDN